MVWVIVDENLDSELSCEATHDPAYLLPSGLPNPKSLRSPILSLIHI